MMTYINKTGGYLDRNLTFDCVDDSAELKTFKEWSFIISSSFLIVVGTIGNTITFCVLRQRGYKNNIIASGLRYLAILDNLILWTIVLNVFMIGAFNYDIASIGYEQCMVIGFFTMTSTSIDNWLLVLITITRLVHIRWPFKVQHICSKLNYYGTLFLLHVVIIVVHGGTFLAIRARFPEDSEMDTDCYYIFALEDTHHLTLATNFLTPCILLLIFNIWMMVELQAVERNRTILRETPGPQYTYRAMPHQGKEMSASMMPLGGPTTELTHSNMPSHDDAYNHTMVVPQGGQLDVVFQSLYPKKSPPTSSNSLPFGETDLDAWYSSPVRSQCTKNSSQNATPRGNTGYNHINERTESTRAQVTHNRTQRTLSDNETLPIRASPVLLHPPDLPPSVCCMPETTLGCNPNKTRAINVFNKSSEKKEYGWEPANLDTSNNAFGANKKDPHKKTSPTKQTSVATESAFGYFSRDFRESATCSETTSTTVSDKSKSRKSKTQSLLARLSVALHQPAPLVSTDSRELDPSYTSELPDANISLEEYQTDRLRYYSAPAYKQDSRINSLTRLLMIATFTFLCLNIPFWIFHVYLSRDFLSDENVGCHLKVLVTNAMFILKYCNHCINFFFYCFTGSRFRQELVVWLSKKWCFRFCLKCCKCCLNF